MTTEIHRRVERIANGAYPPALAKLKSGFAVMGDPQVLPGYCLLYPNPVVPHLNAMATSSAHQFLSDMHLLGEAVLKVTQALRINYEILGNLAPALHAHVIPRYLNESPDLNTKPIWFYDWSQTPSFSPTEHHALYQAIRAELLNMGAEPL